MMADNPASWLLLAMFGIYFIMRFLIHIVNEYERVQAERQRESQEFFLKNPLDKSNAQAYNRYINKRR